MTFLLPVKIDGTEYMAHAEYTSNYVGTKYMENLQVFKEVFYHRINDASPDADLIKQELLNGDYDDRMKTALENIIDLAKNGIEDPNDPFPSDPPRKHYLSLEMTASVNQLIKTLKAAGAIIDVDAGTFTITPQVVVNWKNLSVNSEAIYQIVSYALATAEDQNRTLQALVELIYVKTGNQILSDNLKELETALSTTKDALRTLGLLQELKNKIETTSETQKFREFAAANYGYYNATSFVQGTTGYTGIADQASKHFQALQPTVNIADLSNSDTALFLELRNDILAQIKALSATTEGAGTNQENGTLLATLREVEKHIEAALSKAGGEGDTTRIKNALRYWILDNETDGAEIANLEAGEIQRKLTGAITSAQSLNDTQKEEVRRYLFVFEEYYKSAAAILSKITQILERMAQGIAR
jgi:hypothetical protein